MEIEKRLAEHFENANVNFKNYCQETKPYHAYSFEGAFLRLQTNKLPRKIILTNIFVQEEKRNEGRGTQLIKLIKEYSKSNKIKKIKAILVHNHRFLQKQGFKRDWLNKSTYHFKIQKR